MGDSESVSEISSTEEENIKIETNKSKRKKVNIRNIKPLNHIKVSKNRTPSISDSGSDISLESSISSDSENNNYVKKTKKVLRPVNSQRNNEKIYNDYGVFSNPKKISKNVIEDNDSEYSSIADSEEYSEQGGYREEPGETAFEDKQKLKQDLLVKIQCLQSKGFEFAKKYTMTSNYEEMLLDYERVKKFIDTQASIKFSRRCLMACVTGLEFVNKKFDPFNVKLEGWSENVMESIDDYDNIFEKLHEKYASKAEIAPELELLLTLGGSAFMFHLTNSLLKSPVMNMNVPMAQNNPNFMQSMMGMMSQSMNEMNKSGPVPTSPINQNNQNNTRPNVRSGMPPPMETRGQRREMNGPSIDTSLFAGTPLMSNYPKPPAPQLYTQKIPMNFNNNQVDYRMNEDYDEDDRFSLASSSDSSLSDESYIPQQKTLNLKNQSKKNKNIKSGGFELNIK